MEPNVMKLLAAAIAVLPLAGVGMGLGNLFSAFIEGVSRNPSAQKDLQKAAFLGAALTEAIGLFALAVALILLFMF